MGKLRRQNIFIGTSGWSYPEWQGVVYPKSLPRSKMLEYYSHFFHTAEINSTFYQIPSLQIVQGWAEKAPPSFCYSAKFPDLVTHKGLLDLDEVIPHISVFIRNMSPLIRSGKLMALLLQLPPRFGNGEKHDFLRLESFIKYWKEYVLVDLKETTKRPPELVVEFRNQYWMRDQVFDLLEHQKTAYCAVIEPLLPPRMDITNENLFYLRFHGYGHKPKPWFNYCFSKEELDSWVKQISKIVDGRLHKKMKAKNILIYFNNHFSGYAVKNALYVANKLNLPHKGDIESLVRPLSYLRAKRGNTPQKTMDEFF